MIVASWLQNTTHTLQQIGVQTARLDCLVLLEDELSIDRARILAHPEKVLESSKITKLNKKIAQRMKHVPLAYIRGKAAFYGRDFVVNENVLVPRPETEAMIDLLKSIDLPASAHIADIGTGSGCIGITAALELPDSKVYLCDISSRALEVAAVNAKNLKVKATLLKQDLLKPSDITFDVLLANLPYVPTNYPVNQDAQHEPSLALFAGNDGLDLYRTFWQQVHALPTQPNHILTEALPEQHEALSQLATQSGYLLQDTQGLVQHFRKV